MNVSKKEAEKSWGRLLLVNGVLMGGVAGGVLISELAHAMLGRPLSSFLMGQRPVIQERLPERASQTDPKGLELEELRRELSEYKERLADATRELAKVSHPAAPSANNQGDFQEEDAGDDTDSTQDEATASEKQKAPTTASQWRISAIERFIPLSEEQRNRLEESYRVKESGGDGETLEEIVGAENAAFYREQVANAFRKVEEQELEKEVVFTARKLGLSDAQEVTLREIFSSIEAEIDRESGNAQKGNTPSERVAQMVAESKRRTQLRAERVKETLSPQQYEQFLKDQAESPESNMQVFHDAGNEDGGSTAESGAKVRDTQSSKGK